MNSRTWIAWACLSPTLLLACGGLLEVDDLAFDQAAGAGGAAGTSGSSGQSAGGTAGSGGSASPGGAAGSGTGGTAATGGTSLGASGGMGGTGAPDCQKGAEFESDLDFYCLMKDEPAGTQVQLTDGKLVVDPIVAPWFAQEEGFFLYRNIGTQNFVAATRVAVTSISSPGSPPAAAYAGGGLAIRLPEGETNNALISFTTYAANTFQGGPYAHWTLDGQTQATQPNEAPTYAGWLGLCRANGTLRFYSRTDTETSLTMMTSITKGMYTPDVTALTDLGVTAHSFDGNPTPDTRVSFDWFRIARNVPGVISECEAQINLLIAKGD